MGKVTKFYRQKLKRWDHLWDVLLNWRKYYSTLWKMRDAVAGCVQWVNVLCLDVLTTTICTVEVNLSYSRITATLFFKQHHALNNSHWSITLVSEKLEIKTFWNMTPCRLVNSTDISNERSTFFNSRLWLELFSSRTAGWICIIFGIWVLY